MAIRALCLTLALQLVAGFLAKAPQGVAPPKGAPLRAADKADDKVLYALGVNVATQLGDVRRLFGKEELLKIVEGITDYLMSVVEDPGDILRENGAGINEMLQARMTGMVEEEKARGAAACDAAAAAEGATRTASGLVIEHVKEGAGPAPSQASSVSVHYVGTLCDGTVFDSSRARGEPAQFAVNQVIKGWQEALLLMAEGGTAKLTIPADIAYGDGGSGDKIPGGATICFEVELIKVLSGGIGGLIL